MSANIPETKLVSELLKPTGFNCPADLEGKTFVEATEGGGGDVELEDNKSAAINVTAYTSPVVVNPTEGKDAMKKVTVTLTNIPVPGAHAYCWSSADITFFSNFSSAPADTPSGDTGVLLANDSSIEKKEWEDVGFDDYTYEKVNDSTIKLTSTDDPTDIITLTRDTTKDFTLW